MKTILLTILAAAGAGSIGITEPANATPPCQINWKLWPDGPMRSVFRGCRSVMNRFSVLILFMASISSAGLVGAIPATAQGPCGINYDWDPATNTCKPIFSTPTGGCDPYSSGGFTGCLGGNWQDEPLTGDMGFISDNQSIGDLLDLSNSDLLDLGLAICKGMANGDSAKDVKSVLINKGKFSEVDAGRLVASAQHYLC